MFAATPNPLGAFVLEILVKFDHDHLDQWSPTIMAPGTSFMKDTFSTDLEDRDGLGMIQALGIRFL